MNKDNFPLVSCIVTTFNRSDYLEECIKSIQFQTYKNIEIIIVDDGSCQTSVFQNKLICNQFSKCKYYYKENSGQPDSRNYGIKIAKGKFIAFCDDDDFWVKSKLMEQMELMIKNSKCFVITGDIGFIDDKGKKLNYIKSHKGYNNGYIFEYLLEKNRTSSIVPLLRKEVFDKVGLFNPTYTIAEDWEFWRRVSYYFEFYYIEQIHAYVRLHENNMTNENIYKTHVGSYVLYRKLTSDLLKWGEDKFLKKEKTIITNYEWKYLKRILINRKGVKNKLNFILQIFKNSFSNGLILVSLIIKNINNYK